jgi:hypothetical protein
MYRRRRNYYYDHNYNNYNNYDHHYNNYDYYNSRSK